MFLKKKERTIIKPEKRKSNVYFIVAIAAAVLAALLIYGSISSVMRETMVLVAAKDLKPGDVISSTLVVKEKRPGAAIPKDALSIAEIDSGYLVSSNVAAGDVIRTGHTANLKSTGGNLTAKTLLLGPGYRAIALPPDSTAGLVLEVGDKIDVVGVVDIQAQGGAVTTSKVVVSSAPVVFVPVTVDEKDPSSMDARIVIAVKEDVFTHVALAVTKGKVYAGVNADGKATNSPTVTANGVFSSAYTEQLTPATTNEKR
ncbi:MAG: hypothetical protein HPY50_02245 [Firmicutes bacterium]|nr:hypothetical protein [Bacillota bacterium]